MDMVYATKLREEKEKKLFELQNKLNNKIINQDQYEAQALAVKAKPYVSSVTEDNALKISAEYHKNKSAESLNKEQELLEKKIDAETKH